MFAKSPLPPAIFTLMNLQVHQLEIDFYGTFDPLLSILRLTDFT